MPLSRPTAKRKHQLEGLREPAVATGAVCHGDEIREIATLGWSIGIEQKEFKNFIETMDGIGAKKTRTCVQSECVSTSSGHLEFACTLRFLLVHRAYQHRRPHRSGFNDFVNI